MTDEQKAVVAWMRRVLRDRGWTAEQWAKHADVASSTVSRAMRDDYASTTSLPILNKLAQAAKVPSPVDFLRGTAGLPTRSDIANFLSGYMAANDKFTPAELAEAIDKHFAIGPE